MSSGGIALSTSSSGNAGGDYAVRCSGDLEVAVRETKGERLWYELLYHQASTAVHGSPRSFRTITPSGETAVSTGPSLEALAASPVGEATAHRLRDLTNAHLMLEDDRLSDEDVESDFRLSDAISDVAHLVIDAFSEASPFS